MPHLSPVAASASPTRIQTPSCSASSTNSPYIPPAVQALYNTRSSADRGMRLDALDAHINLLFQRAYDADRICPSLRVTLQIEAAAMTDAGDDLRPFARLPMLVALYMTVRQHLAFNDDGVFDTDGLVRFVAARLNEPIEFARKHILGAPAAENAYRDLRMTDDDRGVGAVMRSMIPLAALPGATGSTNVDLILLSSRLSTAGLPQAALRGMNLHGVVLENEVLCNLDLTDTDFSDACFYHCRWCDVVLARTHLQRAVFFGGELRHCQFTEAKLSAAEFLGCTFSARPLKNNGHDHQTALASTRIVTRHIPLRTRSGAQFNPTTGDRHRLALVNTGFRRCDLSDSRFAGNLWLRSTVDHCSLSGARVEETVFSQCKLVNMDASRTHWHAIGFAKTILQRSRFPNSQFEQIQTKNSASLKQLNFEKCRMRRMQLQTSTALDGLDFTDAHLSEVSFEGSMKVTKERLIASEAPQRPCLKDVTFRRTVCDEVQFIQCKLQCIHFGNMRMHGVQFHGCDLGNTRFRHCVDVDVIGSATRNFADQTQFDGTHATIPRIWLARLTEQRDTRRQLDFIGNEFGLLGRILSIPDVDVRSELIVSVLQRVSAVSASDAIDSPLLTALMRDEYATHRYIGAYIDSRLSRRLTEFNDNGMPLPVLSAASAWMTHCPGRLCRLIEPLGDPRQFRHYSPLIAFLLIGAKHRVLELNEADTDCARRIQMACLPPRFPIFPAHPSDSAPATRPLGLFLNEDGDQAVVLHPDAEKILFDPVNAVLPSHPFLHVVKGSTGWKIARSTHPQQALMPFPMLRQRLLPRLE